MKRTGKRALSALLALVMVVGLIPSGALAAGVHEDLVSSLAAVYDGDEERARQDLDALYEAGIIDGSGSMVELDIREDGQSIDLSSLAQRIAEGEEAGAITVNGNEATPEQILQIQQVDTSLELVRLLDQDVEITDEHVGK